MRILIRAVTVISTIICHFPFKSNDISYFETEIIKSLKLIIKVLLCTSVCTECRISFLHQHILKIRLCVGHLFILPLELYEQHETVLRRWRRLTGPSS